jgi:hypothetical protein
VPLVALAVALFGAFVAVLGGAGIFAPGHLLARVTRAQSRLGLSLIAGLRLVVGGALLLAAPAARAPLYLQVVGGLAVVSGAVTPFVGVERFEAILGWWRARPLWLVRAWSGFVLLFGLSLVWAVLPEPTPSTTPGPP